MLSLFHICFSAAPIYCPFANFIRISVLHLLSSVISEPRYGNVSIYYNWLPDVTCGTIYYYSLGFVHINQINQTKWNLYSALQALYSEPIKSLVGACLVQPIHHLNLNIFFFAHVLILRSSVSQVYTEMIRLTDTHEVQAQTEETGDYFLWLKHQASQGVLSAQV